MYITITPQKLGANYAQNAVGFVDCPEKENQFPGMKKDQEFIFNHKEDSIALEEVVIEIDTNTAKLETK